MFTQPCFIRICPPYIIQKLKEFGYKKDTYCNHAFEIDDVLAVYQNNKYGYIYAPFIQEQKTFIDCKGNEDMFFALAALRDDSDRHQWFKHNSYNIWDYCWRDKFIYSTFTIYPNLNEWPLSVDELGTNNWHKATPQEIIEHFKTKS